MSQCSTWFHEFKDSCRSQQTMLSRTYMLPHLRLLNDSINLLDVTLSLFSFAFFRLRKLFAFHTIHMEVAQSCWTKQCHSKAVHEKVSLSSSPKGKNWKLDAKSPLDDVWAKRHTRGRENHKKITIYSPFSTMRVSSNKRCEHIFPSRLLLAYSFHYNLPRGYSFFTSTLWHSNN